MTKLHRIPDTIYDNDGSSSSYRKVPVLSFVPLPNLWDGPHAVSARSTLPVFYTNVSIGIINLGIRERYLQVTPRGALKWRAAKIEIPVWSFLNKTPVVNTPETYMNIKNYTIGIASFWIHRYNFDHKTLATRVHITADMSISMPCFAGAAVVDKLPEDPALLKLDAIVLLLYSTSGKVKTDQTTLTELFRQEKELSLYIF